jgi:hypothetical protein
MRDPSMCSVPGRIWCGKCHRDARGRYFVGVSSVGDKRRVVMTFENIDFM